MGDPAAVRDGPATHDATIEPAAEPMTPRVALAEVTARLDRWDRLVLLVLVTSVGAWTWLAAGGGLHLDDIRAQAYAADQPFWSFIVSSNRTHLSPGARTVDWLHSRYAPFEYWPAAVLVVVTALAIGVVSWVVLRRLLPSGPAVLAGVAWCVLDPALIPGLAWYRQALTIGVPVALMLLAVLVGVAAARTGRVRYAVLAVLAHAAALMFSERAILLPPVLLVAILALGGPGGSPAGWRGLRRAAPLLVVVGTGVTNVLFLLAYRSGEFDDGSSGSPTIAGLVTSTARSVLRNTLPAFLGGPVQWRRVLGGYSFADTPLLLATAASVVVLGVVAVVLLRPGPGRSPARRVVLVALTYVVPLYVLIYVGRVSRTALDSVDDLRLYLDVVVALAIALAVVLHGLARRDPGRRHAAAARWTLARSTVATAAVATVLTAVSWVGWGRTWHSQTTREYFATAVQQVRSASGSIVPTTLPDTVLPAYFQTDLSTANLVRLVNPSIDTTQASAAPQLLDWSGHVVPARYQLVARAEPPANFCGFRLAPGVRSLTVDLPQPVPYQRGELVLLRVLTADTTVLHVEVVDDQGVHHAVLGDTGPTLYRGPHALVYRVPWQTRVTAITVTPSAGHGGLCLTDAPIVLAVPR